MISRFLGESTSSSILFFLKVLNLLNGDLKITILQWETGLEHKYIKESIQGNRLIH